MADFSLIKGNILVTGAAGLIGKKLVKTILASCPKAVVYAMVRHYEKGRRAFENVLEGSDAKRLKILVGDVTADFSGCTMFNDVKFDYIVHAASMTSSRAFVEQPVQIIETALTGTRNMLELARRDRVKAFIYLSSMEVYGAPQAETKIREDHPCNLDLMAVRSSYPESKRMCESMCAAYASEYGVAARVLRLAQTFGEGVDRADTRVFAEFARCLDTGSDIVLHTAGQTKRSYLSVGDAATAILTVMQKGVNGEAYNAANETTYCSIREMAELVAGMGNLHVVVDTSESADAHGYAPTLYMDLDTAKLRTLGWKPKDDARTMFNDVLRSWK